MYNSPMSAYELLLPEDYVRDLTAKIRRAKNRVYMVALVMLEDDSTRELFDELVAAASRGVRVDIGMDIYFTYRELGISAARWSYLERKTRAMKATRKRLVKAGVKVHWLSQFGMFFFARRTHMKWSIVDDHVYSFGGVNLHQAGIASNDYMFRVRDHKLAEHMAEEHETLTRADRAGRAYQNHVIGHGNNLILIDGGRLGHSLIYNHALLYAEVAESIIYVSQYNPTGRVGALLKSKPSIIFYNPWRNAESIVDRTMLRISAFMHRLHPAYHRHQYLHAKYMIFTLPGGQEVAITGSHNFLSGNGPLGTREIALETRDAAIIKKLKRFTTEHVA